MCRDCNSLRINHADLTRLEIIVTNFSPGISPEDAHLTAMALSRMGMHPDDIIQDEVTGLISSNELRTVLGGNLNDHVRYRRNKRRDDPSCVGTRSPS